MSEQTPIDWLKEGFRAHGCRIVDMGPDYIGQAQCPCCSSGDPEKLPLGAWLDDKGRLRIACAEGCRQEQIEAAVDVSTVTDFSQIKSRKIRWLWRDRIAQGKVTALAGRPKIGKGLLYSHLAAAVSRGELDGDLNQPGHVLIVTTEDAPGDTLKPRLQAAGADLDRVSFFQMGSPEEPGVFRVPQDVDALGRVLVRRNTSLVVIDPLMEFVDGKHDTHKSRDVRQAMGPLNPLVQDTGCAVLAIFHLNKGASTDAHQRHEASAAFTQIIRGSLLLGHDPDDPDGDSGSQRVVAVSSSNLARIPPALVYGIESATVNGDEGERIDTVRLAYIGESAADSHDLLRSHDPEERTERDEARDYLLAELAGGPRPVKELIREAPCGERTLRKAKKALGIKGDKGGFGSGWTWTLPEGCTTKAASPPPEDGAAFADSASDSGICAPTSPKAARANGAAAFADDTVLPSLDEMRAMGLDPMPEPLTRVSDQVEPCRHCRTATPGDEPGAQDGCCAKCTAELHRRGKWSTRKLF